MGFLEAMLQERNSISAPFPFVIQHHKFVDIGFWGWMFVHQICLDMRSRHSPVSFRFAFSRLKIGQEKQFLVKNLFLK